MTQRESGSTGSERLLLFLPESLAVSLRANATEALDGQHDILSNYLDIVRHGPGNPPLATVKPLLSSLQKLVTNLKCIGSDDENDIPVDLQQAALNEAQAIISLATEQISKLKAVSASSLGTEEEFSQAVALAKGVINQIVKRLNMILGISMSTDVLSPRIETNSITKFQPEPLILPSTRLNDGLHTPISDLNRGRSFSVHRARRPSVNVASQSPRPMPSLDEILQQYVTGEGEEELPDDLYIPSGHEEVSLLDMILESQAGTSEKTEENFSRFFDDIISLYETTQQSIDEARTEQTESSAKLDSLVDMLSSYQSKEKTPKQKKKKGKNYDSDSSDESDSDSETIGSMETSSGFLRRGTRSSSVIIAMTFGNDIGSSSSSDRNDFLSRRNKWTRSYGEEGEQNLAVLDEADEDMDEDVCEEPSALDFVGDELPEHLLLAKILPPPSREEGDEFIDYSRYVGDQIPMPPPAPSADFFEDMESCQEPETDTYEADDTNEDTDGYEGIVKKHAKSLKDKTSKLIDMSFNIKTRQKIASHIQQTKNALKEFIKYSNEAIAATTDSMFLIRLHAVTLDIRECAIQIITSVVASNDCEDTSIQSQLKSIQEALTSRVDSLNPMFIEYEQKLLAQEAKTDLAAIDKSAMEDVNIWNDKPESKDNIVLSDESDDGSGPSVNAATLNKIIERMTHERFSDASMMKTFFITYQSFTTPHTVIRKFIERFQVPQRRLPKNIMMSDWQKIYVAPIQMRVGSCLKYWIETRFEDFDEHMLNETQNLLDEMTLDDSNSLLATQIRNLISKQIKAREAAARGDTTAERSSFTQVFDFKLREFQEAHIPKEGLLHSQIFSRYSVAQIAQLMTLVDFRLFAAVQPSELLNQSWNKPKLRYRAPNILAFIARFNQISAWVASIILWEESVRKRKKKLTRIIELNLEFRKLKNYHAVAAICAGLGNSAVHRLKFTRESLRKNVVEVMDELETLMNPEGSYKTYREDIHSSNPPCVPFLGVYLRDLVFIEDGNPDTVGDNLINFQKRRFVYNVIQEICQYQQTPYKFDIVEPLMSYCTALPAMKDEDLYKLSLLREGRNATREEIFKNEKNLVAGGGSSGSANAGGSTVAT